MNKHTVVISEENIGVNATVIEARAVVDILTVDGWNVTYGNTTPWCLSDEIRPAFEAAFDAALREVV